MDFIAGVCATVVGFVPGLLLLVAAGRKCQSRELESQQVCDHWREVAMNTLANLIAISKSNSDNNDGDGDNSWVGG